MTMETGIDYGGGPDRSAWVVRCSCGIVVAEGDGPAPTPEAMTGAMADVALGHVDTPLGAQIAAHMREIHGVHRLTVSTRGRITEA